MMHHGAKKRSSYAARVGIDFLTLPVDWRAIEPGPDDDFSSPDLDDQRWTLFEGGQQLGVVQSPTTGRTLLRFTQQTPTESHPFIAGKYKLSGDELEVSIDATLPSSNVDGCGVALLLRLADSGPARPAD